MDGFWGGFSGAKSVSTYRDPAYTFLLPVTCEASGLPPKQI